jgi:hypothetical protein
MAASGFTATGAEFWVGTGVLLGVVAVAFAAVWLMFVPIRLEFDRVELTIRYLLGRSRTLPWFELDLYGPSEGVFVLQFESKTFQIFSAAFSAADWGELTHFLSTRFPECEADGWVGSTLVRWRRK